MVTPFEASPKIGVLLYRSTKIFRGKGLSGRPKTLTNAYRRYIPIYIQSSGPATRTEHPHGEWTHADKRPYEPPHMGKLAVGKERILSCSGAKRNTYSSANGACSIALSPRTVEGRRSNLLADRPIGTSTRRKTDVVRP